ncbi:MAG: aldehyde dehydrogenase [Lachnospiraceae bacterium]|nr:aldehyde dehydrogenase [Lachnospiraceae bacterium]
MNESEIITVIEKQNRFFQSGKTLPVAFRTEQLALLQKKIRQREADIAAALREDLGKSAFESYMCEIGMVQSELSHMLRHLPSYAKDRRVATPLAQFASRSFVKRSPYGTVLVMSPWNYPFLLTLDPLIDALAAGNTVVVKPSAYSPATSRVVKELLEECFPPEYVAVVTGGRAENQRLLSQKFDYIFFTGSQSVGKEVMRRAAEHLTPITLELGGKSPCVVDRTAKLRLAARRIVFGKFLNCGQTCVAPDYIYCDESIADELIAEIRREIARQFGEQPLDNPDYGKIINEKHFFRLLGLIAPKKVVCGGESRPDTLRIAPTVMKNATWDDAVMQEEIFGPLLPVVTFRSIDEAVAKLQQGPRPLALYLFTQDKKTASLVTSRVGFGGGCINDTIIHLATSNMGFGGLGESGMGAYHGKVGFDTFSHKKSIVDKKTWLDLPMRYQPYQKLYERLLRLFLR